MEKHFELTGEVNQGGCHRIRSLVDIPIHLVKAGDIGGWITLDSTLGENCWVSGEATVQSSILEGEVLVSGESLVRNSTVSGKSTIKDSSFVYKSKVVNVEISKDTVIRSSEVAVEENTKIRLVMRGEASLNSAKVYMKENENGRGIVMNSNARVAYSTVIGSEISFLEDTDVRNTTIEGEDITLINVESLTHSSISGSNIYMSSLPKANGVTIKGQNVGLTNVSLIATKVESHQDIEGKSKKNLVEITDSILAFPNTKIKGTSKINACTFKSDAILGSENIQIEGNNSLSNVHILEGHVVITGQNALESVLIQSDILIDGMNQISRSKLETTNSQIKGSCSLCDIHVVGDNNQMYDWAVIKGGSYESAILSGHVTLKDVVSVQGDSFHLKNVEIEGDTQVLF